MTNDYFYNNKSNKKDGLNSYCIPCTFKRAGKWVEKNPKKYKEQKLRKVANKTDIQRQRSRDAANRNRKEGYQKKWRQDNPDKLKVYNLNRMNKNHDISKDEWSSCKEYFNNECAYCGLHEDSHYITWNGEPKKTDLHKEHVDHEGSDDLSNCVPSCRSCNSKKWTYEFEVWYSPQNKRFSEERYNKIIKWLSKDYKMHMDQKEKITI